MQMKGLLAYPLILSLFSQPSDAQQCSPSYPLHRKPTAYEYREKTEELTRNYLDRMKNLGFLNDQDTVSFAVFDLQRDEYIASINSDTPVMPGSIIKIYPMAAYFVLAAQNDAALIKESPMYGRRLIIKMIRDSSNESTNMIFDLVGGYDKVIDLLMPYISLKNTRIEEKIPTDKGNYGRTYKNMSTTEDIVEFFKQVYKGNLPFSHEMMWILGMKKTRPKQNRLTDETCIPKNVEVMNKTGTMAPSIGDAGIIEFASCKNKYAYIVAGIVEDATRKNEKNRQEKNWASKRIKVLRGLSEIAWLSEYKMNTGMEYKCVDSPPKKAKASISARR